MKVRLFADDACLCLDNKNPNLLQEQVNLELQKVQHWLKTNKLYINHEKSNYLIFTKKKINHNFSIHLGKETISRKKSIKYLGITLDEKLTWEPHINNLKSKLSRNCFVIFKIRKYVDDATLRMLYYSLVYPHLQYGISTWGNAARTLVSKIFVKQKCVIKTICYQNLQTHSDPLFKKLEILKLEDVFKFQICKLMFKLKSKTNLVGENSLIKLSNVHTYNTRLANYFIPRKRTNLGLHSFNTIGPKIWMTIPEELKSLQFNKFKKQLKQHFINKY